MAAAAGLELNKYYSWVKFYYISLPSLSSLNGHLWDIIICGPAPAPPPVASRPPAHTFSHHFDPWIYWRSHAESYWSSEDILCWYLSIYGPKVQHYAGVCVSMLCNTDQLSTTLDTLSCQSVVILVLYLTSNSKGQKHTWRNQQNTLIKLQEWVIICWIYTV